MKSNKENGLVIRFVGKTKRINPLTGRLKQFLRTAPARIINGSKTIDLPADEQQKKGFTHADALFLLKHYPQQYKRKVKK